MDPTDPGRTGTRTGTGTMLWLHLVMVQPVARGSPGNGTPASSKLLLLMIKTFMTQGRARPAHPGGVYRVIRRTRTRLHLKRRPAASRSALRSTNPDLRVVLASQPAGHPAPVVNCGAPLNTPPISTTSLAKEEISHALGDNLQGLPPSGHHVTTPGGIDPSVTAPNTSVYCEPLLSSASDQQTSQWLQKHRFGAHLRAFNSFCGADLLRLTRDDLIQICGLADGIRLFYALHAKSLTPRLTIYLAHGQQPDGFSNLKGGVFRAIYLDSLSCGELNMRLASHVGLSADQIADVFMEGPGGIRVLVTDEVVKRMKSDGLYSVEVCQDLNRELYCLLLKPATK